MTQQPVSTPPAGGNVAPDDSGFRIRTHRIRNDASPWVGGAILMIVGLVLLLQNLHIAPGNWLTNWWALFILLPAVGSFTRAHAAYRAGGRGASVIGPLIGGLVFTMVALTFLFNLSWGLIGPILLIVGGVAVLLGASARKP